MFNERLKQARLKANLSKASFAKKLGLIYTTYDNYERGTVEPKVSTLIKIADILNISTDELLGRTNEKERLKKELDEILSNIDYLYLNVKEIDREAIYFDIGLKKEYLFHNKKEIDIVDTVCISKKDVINFINQGNSFAKNAKQNTILNSLMKRIIQTANLQFEYKRNEDRKKYAEYREIVSNIEKEPISDKQKNTLIKELFKEIENIIAYQKQATDKKDKLDKILQIYEQNKLNVIINFNKDNE